ncbi:MAG: trypsin-like peptidase domain-containing protein [Burkholderiales bacterium]|nr:trypsin-like peptidase domain-containing protein [Burkholderiales bacterium]
MKKAALYSSSNRSRKAGSTTDVGETTVAETQTAPAAVASHGRVRAFYARFERPILLVAGALFAVALVVTYARTRPIAYELTQKDIDAAVLHTLENAQLPSFAARAVAAIGPSVVRVTGYGPDVPDAHAKATGKDKGGEKPKDAAKGKAKDGAKGSANEGGGSAGKNRDRLARNDGQKERSPESRRGEFKVAPGGKDDKDDKDRKTDNDADKDKATGVGTGVVIVDKGIILTNLHVVLGAQRIKVRFFDGMESEAAVIGMRPEHDLAVLQAKAVPDDLVSATLRSTADLQVGDQVVAVGFPFGIGPSASAGVVSGMKREYQSHEGKRILTNLIQFDAAANPGNSGGPLVTADGEVVGIVTGILNPTAQRVFIGIGFAVPIENAAAAVGMSPF